MKKIFFSIYITVAILLSSCNKDVINIEQIEIPIIPNYDFTHPVPTSRLEIYNFPIQKVNDLTRLNLKGKVESRKGGIIDFVFNKNGFIVQSDEYRYFYDSLNRIIRTEHPMLEEKYSYNLSNQLINKFELNQRDSLNSFSRNISYSYDSQQRLTKEIYTDLKGNYLTHTLFTYDNNTVKMEFMNSTGLAKTIFNTYNMHGQLVKNHVDRGSADDQSTYFYFYDDKQQVIQEIIFNNNLYYAEWNYEYDTLMNRTKMIFMNRKSGYKEEYVYMYTYDSKGNIITESDFYNGKFKRTDTCSYTYFE